MGGSSSSTSPGKCTVDYESDDRDKKAKVYILKTSVGIGGPMNLVNHWAIVFKFDTYHNPWVIIEGTPEDGKLVANYKSQSNEPSGTLIDPRGISGAFSAIWAGMTLSLKQLIVSAIIPGYVYMSKYELREFALSNPCNGETYILGAMDCQTWVTVAAKKLQADWSRPLERVLIPVQCSRNLCDPICITNRSQTTRVDEPDTNFSFFSAPSQQNNVAEVVNNVAEAVYNVAEAVYNVAEVVNNNIAVAFSQIFNVFSFRRNVELVNS